MQTDNRQSETVTEAQSEATLAAPTGSIKYIIQQEFCKDWEDIAEAKTLDEARCKLNAANILNGKQHRILKRTEAVI